jgi:hypothetical protein
MTRRPLLFLYALIATMLIQPVMAADPPAEPIESRAMDILEAAADHLAKAERFSVVLAYSYDALQASGQKIEFGGVRKALVSRPGGARIEFSRRDGLKGTLLYDGKTATLYNDGLKVYTQIKREGTIGDVMDFLADEVDIPMPARDFLSEDARDILTGNLMSARYLGESIIDGVACDHIALRTPGVDYQVWVMRGEAPLPKRFVIDHKNAPGQPQFRGQFLSWDMAPTIAASDFEFKVEEGVEKIPLIIRRRDNLEETGQ